MIETDKDDETILMQIAAGELVYLAKRDAEQREGPIFEEIETITVEVANNHTDPEAVAKALPRLEHALKRLQSERSETHCDLDEARVGMAAARKELRARGLVHRPFHCGGKAG
jgi:hypothetical protein